MIGRTEVIKKKKGTLLNAQTRTEQIKCVMTYTQSVGWYWWCFSREDRQLERDIADVYAHSHTSPPNSHNALPFPILAPTK